MPYFMSYFHALLGMSYWHAVRHESKTWSKAGEIDTPYYVLLWGDRHHVLLRHALLAMSYSFHSKTWCQVMESCVPRCLTCWCGIPHTLVSDCCYSLRGKDLSDFCGSCAFTIFTVLPHGSGFSDFLGLGFRDLRVRADVEWPASTFESPLTVATGTK